MENILSKLKIKRSPISPNPSFAFLSLPGEIRNQVYEYYAVAHHPKTIGVRYGRISPPPLARVSRQVRQEFESLRQSHGWQSDLSRVTKTRAKIRNLDFRGLFFLLTKMVGDHELFLQLQMLRIKLIFTGVCDLTRTDDWLSLFISLFDQLPRSSPQPLTMYRIRFNSPRVIMDRELLRELLKGRWSSTQRHMLDVIERALDAQDRRIAKEGKTKMRAAKLDTTNAKGAEESTFPRSVKYVKAKELIERLQGKISRMAQWR